MTASATICGGLAQNRTASDGEAGESIVDREATGRDDIPHARLGKPLAIELSLRRSLS